MAAMLVFGHEMKASNSDWGPKEISIPYRFIGYKLLMRHGSSPGSSPGPSLNHDADRTHVP